MKQVYACYSRGASAPLSRLMNHTELSHQTHEVQSAIMRQDWPESELLLHILFDRFTLKFLHIAPLTPTTHSSEIISHLCPAVTIDMSELAINNDIKGAVHPKMKIQSLSAHPKVD